MSTTSDYFTAAALSRPTIRTRPTASTVNPTSPGSPRTPLLGRSISSQFGSPGAFRPEQEDVIIYELGARHISAGFAGESRPRCVLGFGPDDSRRVGDYRQYDTSYQFKPKDTLKEETWSSEHELYRTDLRKVDLALVGDKLERLVRKIHVEYLQLDQKPRKAALVVSSLFPNPLLEVILKTLFNHFSQPPSVTLLASPVMTCVSAGVRSALVVDVGWEETVVTAVGEYRELFELRSVRAGRALTRQMASILEEEFKNQVVSSPNDTADEVQRPSVDFQYAEDITHRLGWCSIHGNTDPSKTAVKIPAPGLDMTNVVSIPFSRFSEPCESCLFASGADPTEFDDHNLPVPTIMHNVLLALPPDLRGLCMSRIIVTGSGADIPGLKLRLLQELSFLIDARGWDIVQRYGSAKTFHAESLKAEGVRTARFREYLEPTSTTNGARVSLSPAKKPIQDTIPHGLRVHDDKFDHITIKAERESAKHKADTINGVVRGVESLGAWSGASLMASLRVKGTCEVEREDFLRHGLRDLLI